MRVSCARGAPLQDSLLVRPCEDYAGYTDNRVRTPRQRAPRAHMVK